MADYQPFPIATLKTSQFNYLEPWVRPEDAFEPLENAQVYRGVVSKRNGSVTFGNQLADHNPVMGIMLWQEETADIQELVVASTQNAYLYDDGGNVFNAITTVSGSVFWRGSVSMGGSITTLTLWTNITPGTVTITDGTTSIVDNGAGGFNSTGNFAAGGTINYTTGSVTLNFTNATSNIVLSISISSITNYFHGTIKNFFNWTNWQPTDPRTFVSSTAYLYMTNNVDPVTLFDGTNLSRPKFYVTTPTSVNTEGDYVTKTFDVKVFQNRLLFILPSINTANNPINQGVFWSAIFNPFDFAQDIVGHGGQLTAATSDLITSFNFLRNICVIRFSKSVWIFRYTGNDFNPFTFQKINATKRTNCPYASVAYDEKETGIGSTGITGCDGVNVQRMDIPIIDFYETEMSEQYFSQAFSQRYDNNNQTWTLYVSSGNLNPLVGSIAPGSDKALIYNFLENTWSTNVFSTPMTCMGTYNAPTGLTWATANVSPQNMWQNMQRPWFSYSDQKSAPILLMGDTSGNVYWMDNQDSLLDVTLPIDSDIKSTRWNPFIKLGQKIQFGYIDFYYKVIPTCVLDITFYIDNSNSPGPVRTLTLDGEEEYDEDNPSFAMKRIYINAMGEFLQMEITNQTAGNFQINGFILWARPAGRLTP